LKSVRRLEDGEEVEDDEEVDYQFLSNYNVLYANCFVGDYSDADNVIEPAASFRLCPSNEDCVSNCTSGGIYTANFYEFVDAFTELQLGAREYACEMVRESCEQAYYDNEEEADYDNEEEDDDFDYNCYINAGTAAGDASMYEYCIDNENEEFQLQEYLECEQFDDFVDADGNALYIGPYCSDSIQIYIGVFSDEYCTEKVGDPNEYEGYEQFQYTASGGTSIIIEDDDQRECARCREHALEQDQNANDKEDEDETLEQCEELYANTVNSCETYMADGIKSQNGCETISDMELYEDGFQAREINDEIVRSTFFVAIQVIFWAGFAGFGLYVFRGEGKSKRSKSAEMNDLGNSILRSVD